MTRKADSAAGPGSGRDNQRRRTRKNLLDAAARLMQQGQDLTLEAVATEALVSRATVYRYFPSVEALLVEAALDMASPDAASLFPDTHGDAVERLKQVDAAFNAMIRDNESSLRMMLIHSLRHGMSTGSPSALPRRQNRRLPLIEAALSPLRDKLKPAELRLLSQAVALLIGTEAMLVCKDVLQLSDTQARKVKTWAMEALVTQALQKRD